MVCEAELRRYRDSLLRLREVGLDPFYPGSSIRDLAARRELKREQLDAYLAHLTAWGELRSCLRRE